MHPHSKQPNYSQQLQSTGVALSIAILGVLTGCTTQSGDRSVESAANLGKLKVVVTSTVLCDLTHQIAATTIDLVCLLKPGTDPHVYKIAPTDRQAIEDAKLILYGGYDLAPDLIKVIKSTSNPAPQVAVDEVAVPNPQKFDEDGKSTIDPHVWHNLQNGVKIAQTISSSFQKIAPNNSKIYQQNTQKITTELTQIDRWIKAEIATIPPAKKILFTTHDAFGYYSTAYGIPLISIQGVSTEEKPTAARIKTVVDRLKQTSVPTIYAESTLNSQLIKAIANETNTKISAKELYGDGLGVPNSEAETYQKMSIANTQAIVEGLGGKYTPFVSK